MCSQRGTSAICNLEIKMKIHVELERAKMTTNTSLGFALGRG